MPAPVTPGARLVLDPVIVTPARPPAFEEAVPPPVVAPPRTEPLAPPPPPPLPAVAAVPPPAAPAAPPTLSLHDFITRNDDRLLNVYVGMKQAEVERIMSGPAHSRWKNPYQRERVQSGDRMYDVWFYLTREPRAGRPIGEAQLTPVILADGEVVALGRYPLKKLRRGTLAQR